MSVPRHLAVIPDGNRRWARAHGRTVAEGHAAGIRNVGRIAATAWARGVETFTFWWGSPANLLHRDPAEVEAIQRGLGEWLVGPGAELLGAAGAGFEAYGRWRALCPTLTGPLDAAIARSAPEGSTRRLVLLMAYDGREEIVAARETLPDGLWTGHLPPVDLVLRTGGEPHLSAGFLLWQIAEAQLAFSRVLWPAFDARGLDRVLARYGRTPRRYGR